MEWIGYVFTLQAALVIGVVLLGRSVLGDASTKTWLGDTNFNNSYNWDGRRVPSAQDRAVFPKRLGFVVQLPRGESAVRSLVLPADGELMLPKTGKLIFSFECRFANGRTKGDSCKDEDLTFLKSKSPAWADPRSWDGQSAAKPALEAIPCPTDAVVFPEEASFSVEMPDVAPRVASLKIAGRAMEGREFSELVSSEEGQRQFFIGSEGGAFPEVHVTSRGCSDASGCECDNEPLRADVCAIVGPDCPPAHCVQPVSPPGNCCPICGAYLLFKYNKQFSLTKFRSFLNNQFAGKDLDYYTSKKNGMIQVILLEKTYEEKVQSYADDLKENVIHTGSLGLEPFSQLVAGPLMAPTSFTRIFGTFFALCFLAISVFVVIFYVNTNSCKLRLDGQRQYLFAVFENQSEEVELYKPEQSVATPVGRRQAFDNPMYGSTTQEVHREAIEDEENDIVARDDDDDGVGEGLHVYAALETVNLDRKADGVKEQHKDNNTTNEEVTN